MSYLFAITNTSLVAIPVLVSDGLERFASQEERVAGIDLADVLVQTSLKAEVGVIYSVIHNF